MRDDTGLVGNIDRSNRLKFGNVCDDPLKSSGQTSRSPRPDGGDLDAGSVFVRRLSSDNIASVLFIRSPKCAGPAEHRPEFDYDPFVYMGRNEWPNDVERAIGWIMAVQDRMCRCRHSLNIGLHSI
jgi:hypothetical protein